MAKKEKKHICEEMPPWLITFSDVMTLMLTFFILLVSMSTVDERRKLVVLGSIIGTFGWNQQSHDVLTRQETKQTVEPGALEDIDNLEALKPLLWEDVTQDLNFQSSRFLQVFSINAEVLFGPDSATLSPEGEAFLDRILPVLVQVEYPLLVAGHTSSMRDELGENFRAGDDRREPDLSWRLSMARALSVYRYLIEGGMNPDMLRVEAFGRFQPHYATTNRETRRLNRRVDLVLDKRISPAWRAAVDEAAEQERAQENDGRTIEIDGFRFDVNAGLPEE